MLAKKLKKKGLVVSNNGVYSLKDTLDTLDTFDTLDTLDTLDTKQNKGVSKLVDTTESSLKANKDVDSSSKKGGGVQVSKVCNGVQKDQQTVLRNQLRRIWHNKNISDMQKTLDALEPIIIDDTIWHDITDFLTKVKGNGSKKALLNFIAARLGLINDGDGDDCWNALN